LARACSSVCLVCSALSASFCPRAPPSADLQGSCSAARGCIAEHSRSRETSRRPLSAYGPARELSLRASHSLLARPRPSRARRATPRCRDWWIGVGDRHLQRGGIATDDDSGVPRRVETTDAQAARRALTGERREGKLGRHSRTLAQARSPFPPFRFGTPYRPKEEVEQSKGHDPERCTDRVSWSSRGQIRPAAFGTNPLRCGGASPPCSKLDWSPRDLLANLLCT
jgi:hypothetical protein